MNAAPGNAFYNEYPELARIRDAIRTPFAAAFPNPELRLEVSTITIPVPRLETRRGSLSPFEQAMEARAMSFHPGSTAVTDFAPAPVPMPPFYGFQSSDLPQYSSQSLNTGEPATQRRRIGEESEWMPVNASQPFASTSPSLQILQSSNSELLSYAKLMGLEGEEGPGFVRKIFNKYNVFPSMQERLDFAKKMFFHLSIAVTRVEKGGAQVTEAQLRKLSIAVLDFAKTMHRHMGASDQGSAVQIREAILDTFNQHPSVTKSARDGFYFKTSKDYHFVSGKNKFTFMCWCAEQGICLNQRELKVLKALRCYNRHVNCLRLLEEIREVVREQAGATDS